MFGSRQDVVDDMKEVLGKTYPKLKIVGSQNGYVEDKDAVFLILKRNVLILYLWLWGYHYRKN